MCARFAVGKLICDHINSHLDDPETQDHVIGMAEFVPWNGELKSEFISLLSKLIRLSKRRPCVAAVHKKLCEILEEGEYPEWELVQEKFATTPVEGAERTQFIKHIQKQGFVNPRILLQSQPCQLVQYMGEFVLSDIIWKMIKELSKQMGIGNFENVPESRMTKLQTAFEIADAWSADCPENSSIGKKLKFLEELAGLEPGWNSRQTPGQILHRMESANGGVKVREELAKVNVQFLFLSSFGASLINAASGLRSWGRFCDTQNWPHFPIQTYQVIQYVAQSFTNAQTAIKYLAHIRKACTFLGIPSEWRRDIQLKMIINGISKAREKRQIFKETLSFTDFQTLLASNMRSGSKMLLKLAWIFILRPNKEIPQIYMGDGSGSLRNPRVTQAYPAVIDLELDGGQPVLVLKFQKRKAHHRPEFLERRCSCGQPEKQGENLSIHCGPLMCPIHTIWPQIRHLQAGTQLFPDSNAGQNLLSEMQQILMGRTTSDPDKLTLYAIRRGAINYFLYKGGSIDQLIRAGLWRSTAVLAYLERAKIMGILYAEDAIELAEQRDKAAPEEVLEE